ncbi:inverse autotransporter beta domain-containing protein [Sodalis sp. RH21]|uniref:inverse autotransporter beta domain-containing protein n=1 Tax=unclassified Sodalis (in: enterobacteria) TaxID=2636512 RepID=UPI0039B5FF69
MTTNRIAFIAARRRYAYITGRNHTLPVFRRCVAWAIIAVQLALPLSLAFTPALAVGRSPFSQPAPQLQYGGNTLSIPDAATYPADTGQGSASDMARSSALGAAGQAGQQWLSQFGTARVQLNLDKDFKLDNSAVDLLAPLYDRPAFTLFTQLGIRNKDSRNTVNAGGGVRTQLGNWLYGVNTFYDYDMTGHNRRLGAGAEAWTDNLKLSANGYFGLTDWHQSRDFADYDERPANGYDLRAEAWLPSYPQLGGKLMFEQYRGDNVALFGKDDRQKDPYALTVGIGYTPIPLLTLAGEHRLGKGSVNDTSIIFQLNYRLGASWDAQIDPGQVALARTLAGSRLDLVERNNNIVLDYRRQETIRLSLPGQLTGAPGQTLTIAAQVTSSHGFDRLAWDSAELLAAGGTVSQTAAGSLAVILPPYRYTRAADNSYTLSAVAYDSRGNASNRAATVITVTAPHIVAIADFSVLDNDARADGVSANRVQVKVVDGGGNPLPGQEVIFTASNGARILTPSVSTDQQGLAQAALTHTAAGTITVTARVGGETRQAYTRFLAPDAQGFTTAVELLTTGAKTADGQDAHQIKITVRDGAGNPAAGQEVTLTADNQGQVTPAAGKTDAQGALIARVTNTMAGTVIVTAAVDGVDKTSPALNFVAGEASSANSALELLTAGDKIANGSDAHRVRITLRDRFNNPVAGQEVAFSADNGARLTPAAAATGADGTLVSEVTTTLASTVIARAAVAGFSKTTGAMQFVAGPPDEAASEFVLLNPNPIPATGKNFHSFRLVVRDAYRNPIQGLSVSLIADNGAVVSNSPIITQAGGDTIFVSSLTPGIAHVTAQAGDFSIVSPAMIFSVPSSDPGEE